MIVQTLVLPVYSQEPSSQVSWPYSPGWGIEWNTQSSSPVRTSKPRTSPGARCCVGFASVIDEPTTMTSFTKRGGEEIE